MKRGVVASAVIIRLVGVAPRTTPLCPYPLLLLPSHRRGWLGSVPGLVLVLVVLLLQRVVHVPGTGKVTARKKATVACRVGFSLALVFFLLSPWP